MAEVTEQIGALLQEAAETHHRVYRIVDGADDDWAQLVRLVADQPVRAAVPARCQAGPQ